MRFGVAVLVCASLVGPAIVASAATPGAELWAKRYNGPFNDNDVAHSLAVSPDGTKVFVTGGSESSGAASDYTTLAYDLSTGARLWAKRYNGIGNDSDAAHSLAVSPDGTKVFITGGSIGAGDFFDYATLAYDSSTGARLWVKRYQRGRDASSLAVSPDGAKVFVTGISDASGNAYDYATVAYVASTGARLWAKRYNGPGNAYDAASSLAVAPDGTKVFVTGASAGSTGRGAYATLAYDSSTGARRWVKRYRKGASASALAVSPDGTEVFVTGETSGSTGSYDYASVAYDSSSGARLWAKRYGKGASARSLAVSPDGTDVFVTGWGDDSTSDGDYVTLAYDASAGAKLWTRRYNGPANSADYANSLAVSPDGSEVFVTGSSYSACGPRSYCPDYATLAYDASTGARLWRSRYDGPSTDEAHSLAVSPDGAEVFVTGGSYDPTTGLDYATFAYAA